MRTPFSHTRRRNALLGPGSGIALLIVLALILMLFVLRIFFPGTVTSLARPFWGAGGVLTHMGGGISTFFADKQTLAEERDRLAREVVSLREENAALAARTLDLERLIGARTEPARGVVANVLARPPVSPYDTLVIDRGTRDGIATGQLVTGPAGIPLGTVESVTERSSRVVLYSAPGRETHGWVGENRTPVALQGASSGAFRTSVPRESTVLVGAQVYLPGSGSIPVGTVVRVDSDPSTPRAVIHVRPVANPFSITVVTVEN